MVNDSCYAMFCFTKKLIDHKYAVDYAKKLSSSLLFYLVIDDDRSSLVAKH